MTDNVLKVERLYYPERGMFKYNIVVSSSMLVSEFEENSIPSDYMAAYVCNNLREFVNDGKLSEVFETKVVSMRETGETICPRCGQSVFGKAACHD